MYEGPLLKLFRSEYNRVIAIAVGIGVISGISALLFFEAMQVAASLLLAMVGGITLPAAGATVGEISNWQHPSSLLMLLPVICMGALLSGFIVYRFAPECEGAGTDAAIAAYHGDGRIRWRVPLVKAVSSVLVIGSGGSAGRLGPMAQISAGFGSIFADLFHLDDRERRIVLATGIGAGIATIFKAPLGGAILCAEIMYRGDFESDVIVPSFLASIIGYAIFGYFEGYDPVFSLASTAWTYAQIPLFLILGVVAGLFGLLYIWSYKSGKKMFSSFFAEHGAPIYLKPVSGAFGVGLFVILISQISPDAMLVGLASLGTGYGVMQVAMYGLLPFSVLLFIPFAKIFTTSLTIGSGGSGGLFGPALVIGAGAGGALGTGLHMLVPQLVPLASVPAFVVVGMIALFGGISNAPVSVLIMIVEMTGNFSLLVPAMGAVAISFLITSDETIFDAQVKNRAYSPAHRREYRVDILEDIPVSDAMVPRDEVITVAPDCTIASLYDIFRSTHHTGFPVVANERLCGVITITDVRAAEGNAETMYVKDFMTTDLVTMTGHASLETAVTTMAESHIRHIPVVYETKQDSLAGFLTSADVMRSYMKHLK